MQAEQFLCWSGMTDTKHTTLGSKIEEERLTAFAYVRVQLHKSNQR